MSMLNCAVIGAGFSGLALCYYLLDKGQKVTVFDGKGVGGGASGIASGLMHPYPGENANLSWKGEEAMQASKELFTIVDRETKGVSFIKRGVLRLALTEKQKVTFLKRSQTFYDVEWLGDVYTLTNRLQEGVSPGILIRSGVTVHPQLYLKGLWEVCRRKGARLVKKNVVLDKLKSFDQVAIAAGKGVCELKECSQLRLKMNKGQILQCEKPSYIHLTRSVIGKGYIALSHMKNICYLGSTYERGFETETPCLKTAKELILTHLKKHFPLCSEFKILKCLAAIRVSHQKSYHPIADQIDSKTWVLTAMGSRGLLYHSYLGKKLACAMVNRDAKQLPEEVRIER